jgi:hypothetical protein
MPLAVTVQENRDAGIQLGNLKLTIIIAAAVAGDTGTTVVLSLRLLGSG